MSLKIKSPYEETPYQALSDSDLGPLGTDASRKEVEKRFALLTKKGRSPRTILEAWKVLRSPAQRIGWDIFCAAPAQQKQQALQELAQTRLSFEGAAAIKAEFAFDPALLVWDQPDSVAAGADFACREVSLELPVGYDEMENPLKTVTFDL